MDDSGERRDGNRAPVEHVCADCAHAREQADRASCALREHAIRYPRRTFCANHPAHAGPRAKAPIGPVFVHTDRGWKVQSPSIDSRSIRDHLLHILEDSDAARVEDLTLCESVALWQLQVFGDHRVYRFVDGIDGVGEEPGEVPGALMSEAERASPPAPADSGRRAGFVPAHGRAKLVRWLLIAGIVLAAISIVSSEMQVALLQRVLAGESVEYAHAAANDSRQQLVAEATLGLWLLTGLAFVVWSHRAYKNLPALGATVLRYSPGWAIGGWFVPFANLVIPYRLMRELWVESSRRRSGGAQMVAGWWSAYLAMSFGGAFAGALFGRAADTAAIVTATRVDQGADLLRIAAAVLAILVVRGVDARQNLDESLSQVFD